jgi:spore coat polysaccharide biosynthesis protein SpsF
MNNRDQKIVCTIEARMGSTRLPGKVLRPLAGRPMLQRIVERVRLATSVSQIVIATATGPDNDPLERFAEEQGIGIYRGSEDDVLGRLAGAAKAFDADALVALTGDNPFIDPQLIDDMIAQYLDDDIDYLTTTHMAYAENWPTERTFPRGVTAQIVRASALLAADAEPHDMAMREHATMAVYRRDDRRFSLGAFDASGRYAAWRHPELRMTVDTPGDFEVAELLVAALGPDTDFSTGDAIALFANRPDWQSINQEPS